MLETILETFESLLLGDVKGGFSSDYGKKEKKRLGNRTKETL